MSKPCIEYHYTFEWHGRPYAENKAFEAGMPVEDVLKEVITPGMFGLKFSHHKWPAYAWPGGYEIHYYTADGGVLCHQCANEECERTLDTNDGQFHIVLADTNYEEIGLFCDHCGRGIPPAYGDDE